MAAYVCVCICIYTHNFTYKHNFTEKSFVMIHEYIKGLIPNTF